MRYPRAFNLIEIIVALFLVVVIVPAINNTLSLSVRSLSTAEREVEAAYLAAEALEAVRNLRDASWSTNIANKSGTYYLVLSGNNWVIQEANSGLVNNLFSRVVTIANVSRDNEDNIVTSGGTVDVNTKLVTSTVSWETPNGARTVTLRTYLTNFQDN